MKRTIVPLTFALVAACGGAETDPEGLDAQLSESFGGLTTNDGLDLDVDLGDESELVGEEAEDPDASSMEDAVDEAQDPDTPEVMRPDVYVVTVLWGRTFDPTVATPTVWDPTISTSCGRIAVRRRVRLESGEGVLRPRNDPTSVSIRSVTLPHNDGISIVVSIPPESDCRDTATLSFESAPIVTGGEETTYTATAALSDLAEEALVKQLPDNLLIAGTAEKVEPALPGCRKGRAIGYWVRVPESNGGLFHGRVIDRFERPIGRLGGLWGTPDSGEHAGEQVFFGKIVGRDDRFDGLIAGEYTASSTTSGTLTGAWHVVTDYRQFIGGFTGTYSQGSEAGDGVGLFLGHYASTACSAHPEPDGLAD